MGRGGGGGEVGYWGPVAAQNKQTNKQNLSPHVSVLKIWLAKHKIGWKKYSVLRNYYDITCDIGGFNAYFFNLPTTHKLS